MVIVANDPKANNNKWISAEIGKQREGEQEKKRERDVGRKGGGE